MSEVSWSKVNRWLGDAWLCPDCGRVLRKPNRVMDGDHLHSMHCPSAMVRVTIDWPVRGTDEEQAS